MNSAKTRQLLFFQFFFFHILHQISIMMLQVQQIQILWVLKALSFNNKISVYNILNLITKQMSKSANLSQNMFPKLFQAQNFDKIFNSFHASFASQQSHLSNLQQLISAQVDSLKSCKLKCKTRLLDAVCNLREGYRFFSQDLKNEWSQICQQFIDISTKICVVFIQQMMKIEQEKGQWKSKCFELEEQNKELKNLFQKFNNLYQSEGNFEKSQKWNTLPKFQSQRTEIYQMDTSQFQFSSKKVTPFSPFGTGTLKNLPKPVSKVVRQCNIIQNEGIIQMTEEYEENDQKQLIGYPITELFEESQANESVLPLENRMVPELSTILKNDNLAQSVQYNFEVIKVDDYKNRHNRNHSSSYNGQYNGCKQQVNDVQFNDITNLTIKHSSLTKKYMSRKSNRSQNHVWDKSLDRLVQTRNKSRRQWEQKKQNQQKKNDYGCVRSSLNRFLLERGLRTYNYRSVI